jgi:hypothetical protein
VEEVGDVASVGGELGAQPAERAADLLELEAACAIAADKAGAAAAVNAATADVAASASNTEDAKKAIVIKFPGQNP